MMHAYTAAHEEIGTAERPLLWPFASGSPLARGAIVILALGAMAVILQIDGMLVHGVISFRAAGVLDEVAHAATMVVILGMVWDRVSRRFVVGSLLGAVILDVDHVTVLLHMYTWAPIHGRPYSHSLATVGIVALLTCLPRTWRPFGGGIVCGILCHLFRDLATGVVPLYWPITPAQISYPHDLYVAVLVALIAYMVKREVTTQVVAHEMRLPTR